jgi:uncharacterized protein
LSRDIEALGQLFTIDNALRITDEEIAKARQALAQLSSALKVQEARGVSIKIELTDLDKKQREAQMEVRSMMQQLDHSREKMNRSRTERETNAVTREMEELRKLMRDREIEVERIQTQARSLVESQESGDKVLASTQAELSTVEGPSQIALVELEGIRAQHLSEREAISKSMTQALFRKYETIRLKRGSGVATTSDGTCRACNMSLAPQTFHRLQGAPLVEQCPSCNRLIYYVHPPALRDPAGD